MTPLVGSENEDHQVMQKRAFELVYGIVERVISKPVRDDIEKIMGFLR